MYKRITKFAMICVLLTTFTIMSVIPVNAVSIPEAKPIDYKCTGDQANDIVGIALTQVGYEGIYSGGKKYSAYGKWYNSSSPSGAWCAKFVSWCAYKAGISTAIVPKTSISYDYKTSGIGVYHAKKNYLPKVGDLVLYKYPKGADRPINHVGIVRENAFRNSDGVIVIRTVEGNVLNGDTNKRGKVARLGRSSTNDQYKYIVGFITPPYNTIVTYNANGGSGAPAKQTKKYGKSITLSTVRPTRSGYTFQGWSTSASSATPSYYPGSSYSLNKTLNLYACWKSNAQTGNTNSAGYNTSSPTDTNNYNYGQTDTNYGKQLGNTSNTKKGQSIKKAATSSLRGTRLTKCKRGRRKIKLQWKRIKGIGGYQIQFSTKKSFSSNVRMKKIYGAKKTKTTLKKLKAKKYYVRIRTFRVIGTKTEYSAWSKVRSIKCRR